jgi:5-deoxy-glucuronate isomerase
VTAGDARWVLPYGTAAAAGWQVVAEPGGVGGGWRHTSLRVATLTDAPGAAEPPRRLELPPDDWEYVVVPLSGAVRVEAVTPDGAGHAALLAGRADVFAGPTDVAYVPAGSRLALSAAGGTTRVAVAGALVHGGGDPNAAAPDLDGRARQGSPGPAAPPRAFRHVAAADVPVERRGAGAASREVRNFATPAVLDADALIACEVITPAGNWSSWPPHKHDVERPGSESELEEIYYFETAPAVAGAADPAGYHRVYASSPDRPIDVLAEVRTGDVVLVPYGWHGPSAAPPDAHLYYLNVMAGPGPERAWLICDDPAHAAVRATWPGLPFDPRLPLHGGAGRPDTPPGGTA